MATAAPENTSRNRLVTVSILAAGIAAVAYMVGSQQPKANAPTIGTIAPAERYRSSQIAAADVALGDTGVPLLMQTDAFELMVKNPAFRVLATDPGFIILARNP
ncbi:MAG: hypothetical protein ACRC1J_02400, partial [Sandaracinobacteroides sp.]